MARRNPQVKTRSRRKNFQSFSLYIYKVLKSIANDVGISRKGMAVVNSLVTDMFEQIAVEASKLVRYTNKKTLSSNDIMAAVKLLLTPDLGSHAILEASKSLNKFTNSR